MFVWITGFSCTERVKYSRIRVLLNAPLHKTWYKLTAVGRQTDPVSIQSLETQSNLLCRVFAVLVKVLIKELVDKIYELNAC